MTTRSILVRSLGAFVVPFALIGAQPALADDVPCTGPPLVGPVDANVIVPPGGTCVLSGAVVSGNVTALPGANALVTTNNTTIAGNVKLEPPPASAVGVQLQMLSTTVGSQGNASTVQSEGARKIEINSTTIWGNAQIKKTEWPALPAQTSSITNTAVGGFPEPRHSDLQLEENRQHFDVVGNLLHSDGIGGNLQAYNNTGGLNIIGNRIRGNLQCFDNNPPPVSALNVATQEQGQCPDLP